MMDETSSVPGMAGKRIGLPASRGEGEKRTRLNSPSPSPQQGVKDLSFCVRLSFNEVADKDQTIEWLRLKIPGTLIKEFVISDTDIRSISDNNYEGGKVGGDESNMENKVSLRLKPPDTFIKDFGIISVYDGDSEDFKTMMEMETSLVHSLYDVEHGSCSPESDLLPPILNTWKDIRCTLHPENGPFEFKPLAHLRPDYIYTARCAALGSVIYALGGHFFSLGDDINYYSDDCFGHDVPGETSKYFIKYTITGPSECGGRPSTSCPPKPNSNLDPCHRFHFCDFSKKIPEWQVSPHPLNTPRLFPKLLSFNGKLYAFGGNHPFDENSPFAEVYDPNLEFWEAIPNPPFRRLAANDLFVLPLPKSSCILVLGAYSQISYKFDTLSWMWSPFPGTCVNFLPYGRSTPVFFDDTIYWIHRNGTLCVYNFGNGQAKGKYYEGFITGFEGLQVDSRFKKSSNYPVALVPVSRHLLGLFWCSLSYLHFSLVRVSLLRGIELNDYVPMEEYPNLLLTSLTASVVASLTFPFPNDYIKLLDAYLIDDEECEKLPIPCTDID